MNETFGFGVPSQYISFNLNYFTDSSLKKKKVVHKEKEESYDGFCGFWNQKLHSRALGAVDPNHQQVS